MRKWVFPNSRLPQELYIFPLNISSLNASVIKSIFSVVYWAVGGLDPSGHPWIYPMVSILFPFSNISCRWIYPQSNPTISLPDWFVRLTSLSPRLTSLSPRWTGARNPSRRLSQRLALLLVSDADHHPHLEPGPDYKDHEDCGDGKMTKVQKMIMMLVKTEFERTQN